ncbi:pyrroline-5-carboxylate reductase [Dyadobacter jejuensis]|uniref:Pyrroline-5-carboxylate reductase n=1 Tax=Dyadobacter jejuensis TaxID=1082580 RepID=A0A316ARX9_9BACT|nr:pyrroline-5-carboxylate reductase [Dyadobacter jejuensis]PWJ60116.1 pyrroline-5-carboxylate reductase [Dyadobacter jejuensis]
MKIAIIGCGNMGMAFAKAFLKFDLVKKEDFLLVEKGEDRLEKLASFQPGVITGTVGQQIAEYDLIILSVKPQDFHSVAQALKPVMQPQQIVLSIMAGITIQSIQEGLAHKQVIRAMPNTPAMLGMGITAYAASEEVDSKHMHKIENLINATGRSVFLEDEDQLNAVTALSGSGPAYFFYMVKAMIEAGKDMGFEESVASLLVKQTMLGSYHLIQTADRSLDDLIKAVTSKGGTTEAALQQFEKGGLADTLKNGIATAQKRSIELSKG